VNADPTYKYGELLKWLIPPSADYVEADGTITNQPINPTSLGGPWPDAETTAVFEHIRSACGQPSRFGYQKPPGLQTMPDGFGGITYVCSGAKGTIPGAPKASWSWVISSGMGMSPIVYNPDYPWWSKNHGFENTQGTMTVCTSAGSDPAVVQRLKARYPDAWMLPCVPMEF
jgi:hypothetical protein